MFIVKMSPNFGGVNDNIVPIFWFLSTHENDAWDVVGKMMMTQIMWWRKQIKTAVNVLRNLSKWKSPTLTTFKCLALVFIYRWPRFRTKLQGKAIYKYQEKIFHFKSVYKISNSSNHYMSILEKIPIVMLQFVLRLFHQSREIAHHFEVKAAYYD